MNRFARRTLAMAQKEMLHILRDVRVLYLALVLPVVMLLIFGYGVSLDVDHIPLAVVDQDGTRASRRLAEGFFAGGEFVRAATLPTPEQAEPLLRRGKIKAVLVIEHGYQRDLGRGAGAGAQLLVDGSDGTVATIAMGDAAGIAQQLSLSEGPAARGSLSSLSSGPAIRARFNPAMRSAYSTVPGVVALILAMVSAILTALTVAREWERGSMEQLFATPVGRAEIILGKLIPYAGIGFVQTLLVLTLGSYIFDVPIVGSLALIFGASALFVLDMLGVGLLISVVTRSQLVSVQGSLMVSMLPAMLLSGFLFPIQNMPLVLRVISALVPARYYLLTLRGALLKGNGVAELWPQLLALGGFACAVLGLSVFRFRRRLA